MKVGRHFRLQDLKEFDAVVLCGGATKPRDLPMPGRELDGIHFAMDFLTQQNRASPATPRSAGIPSAQGKRVIVIGGGDTGSDCIGTALRQGATSVTSFELMPMPPEQRADNQPWPYYPMRLRTSSSHKEGGQRYWAIPTKNFVGAGGRVRSLVTVNLRVRPLPQAAGCSMREVPGTRARMAVRAGPAGPGFRRAGTGRRDRAVGRGTGRPGQRQDGRGTTDQRPRDLRRRRHAARPVAHRLGDLARAAKPRAGWTIT